MRPNCGIKYRLLQIVLWLHICHTTMHPHNKHTLLYSWIKTSCKSKTSTKNSILYIILYSFLCWWLPRLVPQLGCQNHVAIIMVDITEVCRFLQIYTSSGIAEIHVVSSFSFIMNFHTAFCNVYTNLSPTMST